MKTKAFIIIKILGIFTITMVSCAKDDTPFDYEVQPTSAPVLHHMVDSIYTPFFTSGSYNTAIYVAWGKEKGNITVTAPDGVLIKNELPYGLTWDQNLGLGIYPIIVTAESSEGMDKDNFVLVSYFGGHFVRSYNFHPESSISEMSIRQPFQFDQNGELSYYDPWDFANSISGNWSWVSKNEIQGSYSKSGQIDGYTFRVTLDYENITGLPKLNGYWYVGAVPVPGEEKGCISFYFDRDSEFATTYYGQNNQWDPGSASQDYPQIYHPFDPIEKDTFGGWFTAYCDSGPNEKGYRLYLGLDKKIFRGVEDSGEAWHWISDNEIQGTFLEHSDFSESEEKHITFKGSVSIDQRGLPMISGNWYSGKEAVQGLVAGRIKLYYENWDDWWGEGW